MPSPVTIKCIECGFFEKVKMKEEGIKASFIFLCPAFPKGIPEEIRSWKEPHKKIRDDQEGEYIFKPEGD